MPLALMSAMPSSWTSTCSPSGEVAVNRTGLIASPPVYVSAPSSASPPLSETEDDAVCSDCPSGAGGAASSLSEPQALVSSRAAATTPPRAARRVVVRVAVARMIISSMRAEGRTPTVPARDDLSRPTLPRIAAFGLLWKLRAGRSLERMPAPTPALRALGGEAAQQGQERGWYIDRVEEATAVHRNPIIEIEAGRV